MRYAPLFLKLEGATAVIIGGGPVASGKAESLLGFGVQLRVVAPEILPELRDLLAEKGSELIEAPYSAENLAGAAIVIAATDDRNLNARIHADAKARGLLVNVVDTPALCDFIFPAVVTRGGIQVAISTAGVSPSLARFLKRRIEQALPWNLDQLAAWIGQKRKVLSASLKHIQSRRLLWDEVLEGPVAQEVLEGNYAKADALFAQSLAEQETAPRAALYLIGAGPGHPDLITVRAAQLLAQADVVLYDRLIPFDALARYARKEALKISVGKSAGDHGKTQEQINLLIEEHLRANKIVVRLKGGDPGIYGHAAEELEIARRLDVPYQIVPGITAATGCAAFAGIPLTEREGASGVRFLTLYDETLYDEQFWQSLALATGETLVFYMSTRRAGLLCEKLVATGFRPQTPLLVIEQGTTPAHAEREATLETFAEKYKDFSFVTPALLIVGDVVRWRARFGWKEPPRKRRPWFTRERKAAHAGD